MAACKYCGEEGLRWVRRGGWRLQRADAPHVCLNGRLPDPAAPSLDPVLEGAQADVVEILAELERQRQPELSGAGSQDPRGLKKDLRPTWPAPKKRRRNCHVEGCRRHVYRARLCDVHYFDADPRTPAP
jgi:hypothetical protein